MGVEDNVARHRQARALAAREAAGGRQAAARPSAKRPSDSGRWQTLNTFVDAVLADSTASEVRVWLVLFRDVKPGGLARAGMTDIARRAGLSRRAVVNAVNALKRRRLIEVVARGSINGTPNAYRMVGPT